MNVLNLYRVFYCLLGKIKVVHETGGGLILLTLLSRQGKVKKLESLFFLQQDRQMELK